MTGVDERGDEAALGVIGGLGPAATVAFMDEVIRLTPAECDQDHIEMIVYNDPKVPDRNYPEQRDSDEGPLARLRRNAIKLEGAGADLIVIASNTTHGYHDEIAAAVDVPVPHMIDLVRDHLDDLDVDRVGVLTTVTAVDDELFDVSFQESDIETVYPSDMESVMDSIYAYKRGEEQAAKRLMDQAVADLEATGTDSIVLGCTEFSALPWDGASEPIDAATVLAEYCIEFCQS